jgi:hypothetical protein
MVEGNINKAEVVDMLLDLRNFTNSILSDCDFTVESVTSMIDEKLKELSNV